MSETKLIDLGDVFVETKGGPIKGFDGVNATQNLSL